MRKKFLLFPIGAFLIAAAVLVKVFIFDYRAPAAAALRIDSSPKTTIYLNDEAIGATPYLNEKIAPGEYRLKLVPVGPATATLPPWEEKIKVVNGAMTYVSRELGASDEAAAGQVLIMEKSTARRTAEIAVVSTPDKATVEINGEEKGTASLVVSELEPGDYLVTVSKEGYATQIIRGRVVAGYRLLAVVKLRRLPPQEENRVSTAELIASASGQILPPLIIVKETELGFLRVRQSPDPAAEEIDKIYPGEKYSLIGQENYWVKIRLTKTNQAGWVHENYVEIKR